ncbi:MAG TPA: hypothetical protein VLW51_06735 [Solirubrobacteraceae bacterium]|jgi:hypothetical protein|nr:hypothetical protein [Solirubrobacteraceae bacterium]
MPTIASYLAGSLISLLFPILLLIGIAIWYVLGIRRFAGEPRDPSETDLPVTDAPRTTAAALGDIPEQKS